MRNGLIVFAREPLPGSVKTRLAAAVGDGAAAVLYEAMLRDVLESVRQLSDIDVVVFWACAEESLPLLEVKYRCRSRRQGAGDLGQRMQGAFEEMFADGCGPCCIIGSDAPDLPVSYILDAYRLLETERFDIVLGPSRDGGYYLLGMGRPSPQLFAGIPWSTSAALECTLAAARAAGFTAALLPEWQDIDTVEDLHAFKKRKGLPAEETI